MFSIPGNGTSSVGKAFCDKVSPPLGTEHTESPLTSCDRRLLGSDEQNGDAKRSLLTSNSSTLLGVKAEHELFGVCSTAEEQGHEGKV